MKLEIFWMTKDHETKLGHILIEDMWQMKDSYKLFFKKENNRHIDKWAKNMNRFHRERKTQRSRTSSDKHNYRSEQSGKCQSLENWHALLFLSDWKKKKKRQCQVLMPL